MTNLEKFREAYIATLTKVVEADPEEYAYEVSEVPKAVDKMIKHVMAGEDVVSVAIKSAAKKLKIKPTLTAIREYLNAKPE